MKEMKLSPLSAKAVAVLLNAIQKIVWMKISLIRAGKRFNRDWIFRNLSYEFIPGNAYAITGPNGSGKSTLLQIIAGAMGQSEGNVQYVISNKQCESDQAYQYIS